MTSNAADSPADMEAVSLAETLDDCDINPSFPFIDDDADVVLRSADGVDFNVHRLILSKSSGLFKDLFKLPQATPSPDDPNVVSGRPLVPCSENKFTLRAILLFIYPGDDPALVTLYDAGMVLDAAIKYELDFIANKVRQAWAGMAKQNPLKAFAISCLRKWKHEATAAARFSLGESIWPLEPPLSSEYDMVSANTILRLEQYHRRCSVVARSLATDNKEQWHQVMNSEQCEHCNGRVKTTRSVTAIQNCLNKYLVLVAAALATRPAPETASDPDLLTKAIREAHADQMPCEVLSHSVELLRKFVKHFSQQLEMELSKVTLELDW